MEPIESHFPLPETELRKLSEVEAVLESTANHFARETAKFIRQNPWEAMGIACLAGLLLGVWAGSRD